MPNFKLISSTKAHDVIPVDKYVSEKTGLTIFISNVEGPVVRGYFFLATEAQDDDGLPHTLEHLIFKGSERYPYNGILDALASRCMARGTNAYTTIDHTCYYTYTAGDEGMLTLLPIYLDHILNPTLTDLGYLTEVHHIDSDGKDAGVVYSEMQGLENTSYSRCLLKLQRAIYPNNGYSAKTGGIMKNLRTSTNITKVREFHKKFYRPENLKILIMGQIEAENVFKALATVEDDIIAKREKEPQEEWVRPWQSIPGRPHYGDLIEQWPADIEDCGLIMFGWRGPTLTEPSGLKDMMACRFLLRYLCNTATAPLQRCLVERKDSLVGNVSFAMEENLASSVTIILDNVPLDKLEAAKLSARQCLDGVRDGSEPLDTQRLQRLLKKDLREDVAYLESDLHNIMATCCVYDALYSQNERDFVSRMNPQRVLHQLIEEGEQYWRGLLQKYFTDDLVTLVGSPSIELQAKMAEDEKNRLEDRRARLGESGLAENRRLLEEAMKFNEREPPAGTLDAVPVSPYDKLKSYSITTWSSEAHPCPHLDLNDIPMYTMVHSLKTNFVYINLIFDTSSMEQKYRKWVPVLLNGLAECPVRRGDTLVPHEQIVATTEELTVSFKYEKGFNNSGNFSTGSFCNLIHVEAKCEPADYVAVVNHLYEVLYAAEITKERLLVFAQRLVNEVADVRTEALDMVHDILRDELFNENTNLHWCSVLRQQKFLNELIERLNNESDATAALAEAREAFSTMTQNVWLHLATDLDRFHLTTAPWKRFARENVARPLKPTACLDAGLMSWEKIRGAGLIVGVGGAESEYLLHMAPGPSGYSPEDSSLIVALKYFTQIESPMSRIIRGSGLAYGYTMELMPGEGVIAFSLYRATNTFAAYTKAKHVLEEFVAKELDPELFLSARNKALFEAVEDVMYPADAVAQSLLNYCRGAGEHFNDELLQAIGAVSEAQAREAARRWLPALFDVTRAKLAVVCHPSKVNDMQAAFAKINIDLEAFESMEASNFNK